MPYRDPAGGDSRFIICNVDVQGVKNQVVWP
jgi:hypothetical protein